MQRVRDGVQRGSMALPAVGTLLNQPAYAALVKEFGRERVAEAIREQVAGERRGVPTTEEARTQRIESKLRAAAAPRLRRVINASGVILHTNLGRAPLSAAAMDALRAAG